MRTFPAVNSLVNAAAHQALHSIQSRYGDGVVADCRLEFHGLPHTVSVMSRSEELARAMGASDHQVMLACIAAAFHDTVQDWEAIRHPDGRVLRRRFAGTNEAASADEAVAWMKSVGRFTGADCGAVRDAILATVPCWDVQAETVKQSNLNPESMIIIRAVALADLATAGMDPEDFVAEGDSLFREENLDIASAIAGGYVSRAQQDVYKKRMIAWRHAQPGFARGRALRLEEELGNLMSDEARKRVRALFAGFDSAVAAAYKAIFDRQDLPFWDMAKVMGYSTPSA